MIRSILHFLAWQFGKGGHKGVRWIVRQIQEEGHSFHTAVLFKISGEESTGFHVHTHGCKYD